MTLATALRAKRAALLPGSPGLGVPVRAVHVAPSRPPLGEIGTTGTPVYKGATGGSLQLVEEDYNPDLKGVLFFKEIERMRKSDSQIKAVMSMLKLPLRAADWHVESASDDPEHREHADWIEERFFHSQMRTWDYILYHILLSLDYGNMMFETVFEVRDDDILHRPMVQLDKLAPRMPQTITDWVITDGGDLDYIMQQTMSDLMPKKIEGNRLLPFVHEMEGSNYRGSSILRNARKDWTIKERLQRINQVAIEKRASGIDVGTMDETAISDARNKGAFESVLQSVRTHERGYMLLPPGHTYAIEGIKGSILDPLPSIKYADILILRGILADFLTAGTGGEGSHALVADRSSFFLMALNGISKEILEPINRWLIPRWVRWNWPDVTEFPMLQHSRLDRRDVGAVTTALKELIPMGVMTPDDNIEKELRDMLDLPQLEMSDRPELLPDEVPALVDPDTGPEAFKRFRSRRDAKHRVYELRSYAAGGPGSGRTPYGGSAYKSAGFEKVAADKFMKSPSGALISKSGDIQRLPPGSDNHAAALDALTGDNSSAEPGQVSDALEKTGSIRVTTDGGHVAVSTPVAPNADQEATLMTMERLNGAPMRYDYGRMGKPGFKSGKGVENMFRSNSSRASSAVRSVDWMRMSSALDDAENNIVKAYRAIQGRQISKMTDEAMKAVTRGDTDLLENVNVPFKNDAADLILKPLVELYRLGQNEVKHEMSRMGCDVLRLAGPLDIEEDQAVLAFLRSRARMVATVLADRLRGTMLRTSMDMIRNGVTDPLVLKGALTELSDRAIKGEAGRSISEALNMGRESTAKKNAALIAAAEYSAIMDTATCPECESLEGKDFVYGSAAFEEAKPPYQNCDGRGRCRCVMIYTFVSESPRKGR